MSKINIKNLMIGALRKSYISDIEKCKVGISIYLNNSVGVAEHPDHLKEIDKLMDNLSNNEDKLKLLDKIKDAL